MISISMRRIGLFAVLLASLAAAYGVHKKEDTEAPVVTEAVNSKAPRTEPPILQTTTINLGQFGHRILADAASDPFKAKSWYVPPPPPPIEPPPKPTAPPLPFQYIGKLDDADGTRLVVYLAKGNESFAVRQGEKFANDYRLENIDRGQVVIEYLPMSQKQRLPMGSPQ